MSEPALALSPVPSPEPELVWARLKALVLDSVTSLHTKRAYQHALTQFQEWYRPAEQGPFSKMAVQAWRAELERQELAPSSINVHLAALRKLAGEAADNGLLAPEVAAGIAKVRGARREGVRAGNWLSQDQAQQLLLLPDPKTLKGKRDQALLALLLGCGLRRAELAALRVEDVQQRDGRWVIVDLEGKGKRVRSVPMPNWAKAAIDRWTAAAGIAAGNLMRPVSKADKLAAGETMTAQSVFEIVERYSNRLGVRVAPHDLRRTFAKLAHRGHAPLEQIQLSLGHASVQTTERYLGLEQDLVDAPCDHLGLRL
ncbi:MAG: tyrosine-type recombinase/integrase [Fimbriimonadaceae bacterium]|nr:tyrosine-type recombinase/integrase [Fimbriimonadaceae bacterium]